MSIAKKAELYANSCHTETNHKYDDQPYSVHLKMVVATAKDYIHLIPEDERESILAGCWVHDVIEDCRQTYNDVKVATNETVAELAYALTNEKGKVRKERANDKYYEGIRNTPYATFIKLCDRIANVTYSINCGSNMSGVYAKENQEFVNRLFDKKYQELFDHLEKLLLKTA